MTQHPTKEEIADHIEILRRLYRTAEMSASVMRDNERTGGWEGSERVARAFDNQRQKALLAYEFALRLEPMREELEKLRMDSSAHHLRLLNAEQRADHWLKLSCTLQERAEAAEAERDALRERVKELRGALEAIAPKQEIAWPDKPTVISTQDGNTQWMTPGPMWSAFNRACAALAKDDK